MMRVFVDTNILIDYALGRDFTTFSLLPVMTAAELLSSVSDTMDLEEARKLLHDMTDKEIEE